MKKKENERMKLMFDLCKTYVTVNVISMSSLCLTYVKVICHNLCNIIVICHKIAYECLETIALLFCFISGSSEPYNARKCE